MTPNRRRFLHFFNNTFYFSTGGLSSGEIQAVLRSSIPNQVMGAAHARLYRPVVTCRAIYLDLGTSTTRQRCRSRQGFSRDRAGCAYGAWAWLRKRRRQRAAARERGRYPSEWGDHFDHLGGLLHPPRLK